MDKSTRYTNTIDTDTDARARARARTHTHTHTCPSKFCHTAGMQSCSLIHTSTHNTQVHAHTHTHAQTHTHTHIHTHTRSWAGAAHQLLGCIPPPLAPLPISRRRRKSQGLRGKGQGHLAAAYLHLVKPPTLGFAFLERPRGRDAGGGSQHGCHWLVSIDSKRTLGSPDVYGGDTGAGGWG